MVTIAMRVGGGVDDDRASGAPIVGVLEWPSDVDEERELVAVMQAFPTFDILQRRVPHDFVWADEVFVYFVRARQPR